MADLNSQVELIFNMQKYAKSMGIMQKKVENQTTKDGKTILLEGKKVTYFGNCSYLGLEHDSRLKEAAKDAIDRYGIQFSCSRSFASLGIYEELEYLLSQIFDKPSIAAPTTTLGHMSSIPVLIQPEDAVILDQQVHASVSNAVAVCKSKGTHVEMIRHNRMDMLESRIKKLRLTHKRIWYMTDGIYSMYGDGAPLENMYQLLDIYEELYLYVDDSHGMSWAGDKGQGYALSKLPAFHDRMVLMASLAKGFGACGAAMVFPNNEMKELVLNIGPTLMFAGPLQPSTMGAMIASAKIHLTDEIYELQDKLRERLSYFMMTAKGLGIPIYSDGKSPVFFIGLGAPENCVVACAAMLEKGYLLNPCSYPSVPYNKSGLRATINNHLSNEDIYEMLTAMSHQMKQMEKMVFKNKYSNAEIQQFLALEQ
jgi:7-keto-8-aminopelargonate synthetase-like enzyme